jgi:sugar O-acyltransferase (sialic acid O-acetyltransferase NeuD family)
MNVIYCAGEQGRVVLDILNRRGIDEELVFVDDDPKRQETSVEGVDVLGDHDILDDFDQSTRCIVAFGDQPGVRLDLVQNVQNAGLDFFNAIDPSATVSSSVTIGKGISINAQTYVGPRARIDDHVLVDSCVNISHDVSIHEGATVTPNATLAGEGEVGKDAYIGPSATLLEGIAVGESATVGAGAVVTEDVLSGETVVGVPAEPLDRE